jgi:hypothetical protein
MNRIGISETEKLHITISDAISVAELAEWLIKTEVDRVVILAPESTANRLEQSFPLNSKFKEILEQHTATFYAIADTPLPTAIIDEENVYYYVRMGEIEKFVKLSSNDATAIFTKEFDSLLESAYCVEIDVPAWSELLTKLESIVGSQTRSEFEQLIEAAQLEEMNSLDAVSVALIAAAQSGALTYDLGKWAEEVGVASKATISRRKTALEEDGIIYTENVPVEVGRPRQRLLLADQVSAVRIENSEVDVSKSTANDTQSKQDGLESYSPSEQENQQRASEEDDLIGIIEQEIQEIISSE